MLQISGQITSRSVPAGWEFPQVAVKSKGGNPPPNPLNIPVFDLQALTENLPKRYGNPRKGGKAENFYCAAPVFKSGSQPPFLIKTFSAFESRW